ncbi:MAG TPA: hypothetical protein VF767_09680 [Bryobacteraceae bacterium]
MIRAVVYLFLAIILISVLRSVVGVLGKLASAFLNPGPTPAANAPGGPRTVGELKRDPVCGTYIPVSTSVKRTVGKEVVHFCSAACSEKYQPGKA